MLSAATTALVRSGGRGHAIPAATTRSRSRSHSCRHSLLMCSKMPAALHSSVTANCSFSSFALRSASGIARSRSYVPSECTTVRERFERAKAYVKKVKMTSVESDGMERRGELWKREEDSVVRQLKTRGFVWETVQPRERD